MAYILRDPIAGVNSLPLNRYYNSTFQDHADAAGSAGFWWYEWYALQASLGHIGVGYPRPEGTDNLRRYWSSDLTDHGSWVDSWSGQIPSGYTSPLPLGWAFPRFGEIPSQGHTPQLVGLSHGGIDMLFDRSWGSAGYSLRWRGREFINASDQGRLLQFALFYWDPQLFDPTEGGDGSGHGSPVLEVTAGGTPFIPVRNR